MQTYPPELKIFDTNGYRETVAYLRGKISLDEAKQQIITNTKHFARRQMQWFKRDKRIHWVTDQTDISKLVADFLAN